MCGVAVLPIEIRDYRKTDYAACAALVDEAWGFDTLFAPPAFADAMRFLYTEGAIDISNTLRLAVHQGRVVGLLFGYNASLGPRHMGLLFLLRLYWRLLWVEGERPTGKWALLRAGRQHERHKAQLLDARHSEVVLFVVAAQQRGQGIGQQLWADFLAVCRHSGESLIAVETNVGEASSYYAQLGFELSGTFPSPLHRIGLMRGQPCIYTYRVRE